MAPGVQNTQKADEKPPVQINADDEATLRGTGSADHRGQFRSALEWQQPPGEEQTGQEGKNMVLRLGPDDTRQDGPTRPGLVVFMLLGEL